MKSVSSLSPKKRPRRRRRQTMTSHSQKSGQLSSHSLYLLAMVFTYFRRGGLRTAEYRTFFFPSLLLANQFEEDEPYHREIFRWALGWTWTMKKDRLLHLRDVLLTRIGFRAWVSPSTCDLIMAQDPDHWAWRIDRNIHHSWAVRWFRRNNALSCSLCNTTPSKRKEAKNICTDPEGEPETTGS
ncbi:speedy protein 1-B-like [Anomaloglossus baeobatrachus]|uniref:speedy protein 1-B-like n=1 Tax=Anomaloglossus baeobatrachus TaxID=238106 RepID=UPI003F4F83D0